MFPVRKQNVCSPFEQRLGFKNANFGFGLRDGKQNIAGSGLMFTIASRILTLPSLISESYFERFWIHSKYGNPQPQWSSLNWSVYHFPEWTRPTLTNSDPVRSKTYHLSVYVKHLVSSIDVTTRETHLKSAEHSNEGEEFLVGLPLEEWSEAIVHCNRKTKDERAIGIHQRRFSSKAAFRYRSSQEKMTTRWSRQFWGSVPLVSLTSVDALASKSICRIRMRVSPLPWAATWSGVWPQRLEACCKKLTGLGDRKSVV